MIVLDTNVVSEPLKQAPNPAVIDWLNAQAPAALPDHREPGRAAGRHGAATSG